MKYQSLTVAAFLLTQMILLGCGEANLEKTHEADLLDNKVLQRRVQNALTRGGDQFQNVQVHADSGSVMLSGTVRSEQARAKAREIAEGVYGAKKVDDRVQVKDNPP